MELIKIVVIGPESTGKSTLCEQLAQHYNTTWVREYAREYLIDNGNEYTLSDLHKIAAGQLAAEDRAVKEITNHESPTEKSMLFIDTDFQVIKVWSELVFNSCSNDILNEIVNRSYDLYLLCEPDIPWVKDELREYPDLITREKLFHHYKEAMLAQSTKWCLINGDYQKRFEKAVTAIDKLFQ